MPNVSDQLGAGEVEGPYTTVAEIEEYLTPKECAGIMYRLANFRLNSPELSEYLESDPYYQCWIRCIAAVARRA